MLVNKCQDLINSSAYFVASNLTSQRVLNDCIAYINFFYAKPEPPKQPRVVVVKSEVSRNEGTTSSKNMKNNFSMGVISAGKTPTDFND